MDIRRILMPCPIYNFNNIIQINNNPMSLYSNHSRNQIQNHSQHQYSHQESTHSRSHSQYRRGRNELDYPRGSIPQNEENKFSVGRYQNERVEQKYHFNHQRSQEECNRATDYFEQISPNRSKYNDFSFQERNQKSKTQVSSETVVRQNARKKGTEMKISNIDQLNDKIYGLLNLIKKEIHKSNSKKNQTHDKSLSPSRSSLYQQPSFDYANRTKENHSNYQANRYINEPANQPNPLSPIQNNKYIHRSVSGKKPRPEYSNNGSINPNPSSLLQDKKDIVTKPAKQPQRYLKSLYENNTGKQFVKKRQESMVMKSIDQLLNERRKMLNIKRQEQPYSYGRPIEVQAKHQEGSPINQFKNQQKALYTIQQNQSESAGTPTEANRPKKYQYFLQSSHQNKDQDQLHTEKHFDFTGKIYKKSQQLTPKKSKPDLQIELS